MVSVFDLFRIGIGPSSFHTVGPMRAALAFATEANEQGHFSNIARIRCTLYGSLGATGKGHGTDKGILLGLMGTSPETVHPTESYKQLADVFETGTLPLLNEKHISFPLKESIVFLRQALKEHPNGMRFEAFDSDETCIYSNTYFSVGGGFIRQQDDSGEQRTVERHPHPFSTGAELLDLCQKNGKSMAKLMWENEAALRTDEEIADSLRAIWGKMNDCIARGCGAADEVARTLPGPLQLRRRAPELYRKLRDEPGIHAP